MFPPWDKVLWSTSSNGKYWSNDVIVSQTQIICFHQSWWFKNKTNIKSFEHYLCKFFITEECRFPVLSNSLGVWLCSDLFSVKNQCSSAEQISSYSYVEVSGLPRPRSVFLPEVKEVRLFFSSNMFSAPFPSSFCDSYNVKVILLDVVPLAP